MVMANAATSLKVEVSEKLYTIQEFLELEWPDDDENEYELIGGQIVAKQGTTSKQHARIASRITTALNNFAGFGSSAPKGETFCGGSTTLGQPLSKGTFVPKPDVCFVLNQNKPTTPEEAREDLITVAPDIVVEINSPSDTDERRFQKLQAYQQAGVRLFWSINMLEKYVVVYKAGGSEPQLITFSGELDGGEVLPGFKLPVKLLFD